MAQVIPGGTVYSYLSKLEGAYIVHRCSGYDIKGKEILNTQEKLYLADSAFRFSVWGYGCLFLFQISLLSVEKS